jgi:hypothetical protein
MKTDSAELYSITTLVDYMGRTRSEGSHSHGVRAGRGRGAGARGVEED